MTPEISSSRAKIIQMLSTIYLRYIAENRRLLFVITFLVLCGSGIAVAAPYLFSRMIAAIDTEPQPDWLVYGPLLYAVSLGVASATQAIVQFLGVIAAQRLSFVASTSFFRKLIRKNTSFFQEHNAAEIQSIRSRAESSLYVAIQLGVIFLVPGIAQLSFALIMLNAVINLEIASIVLVYGVVFIAATYAINIWVRSARERGIKASQENAKFVGNAIAGMETLRYFGGDGWLGARFSALATSEVKAWESFSRRRIVAAVGLGMGLAAQIAVTFTILLPQHAAGNVSLADIVLFNSLVLQLNQPFEMMAMTIDELFRAYAGIVPLANLWAAPEDDDNGADQELRVSDGTLRFDEVGYSYPGGYGLSPVSFVARRGSITFLTGETGAGKSTVMRLALKALVPTQGDIAVDGQSLSSLPRAQWYARIGVVPQDVVLLNDTLESNIILGRPLDQERLDDALRKAAVLEFTKSLPAGLQTNVGERGLKLSGGERQRIAIARALYGSPSFLFLDEASSALDEGTEAQIMQELSGLSREVTILAITHRRNLITENDVEVSLERAAAGQAA